MSIWELGEFTLKVVRITGVESFDYFFTLVAFFGLLGFAVSLLVRVIARS
jgi:hypothetical protein